jgi:Xaa-Pro aminopeptidase
MEAILQLSKPFMTSTVLTEWPSIIPTDRTVIEPGMVLTLEPSVETVDGRIMVHEENIAITENGAVNLNTPAGRLLGIV